MTDRQIGNRSFLSAGSMLDGWIIEASLGSGGMGIVYQATHRDSGMQAALKVLSASTIDMTESLRRFRREVRSLARIRHPHVVEILQEALDHSPPYFAMELIQGGNLATSIERVHGGGSGFSAAFVSQLARELAEGLEAVHAEQVVHRDLKPSNVLFTTEDHAKIADFGMAKALDLTGLTMGQRVMGTLPYMSPEMLRGGFADARSDLYQLGVILFETATGKRPFSGEALMLVSGGRELPAIPLVEEVAPSTTAPLVWLNPILRRLTAADPGLRFQSAAELREALDIASGVRASAVLSVPSSAPPSGDRSPSGPAGTAISDPVAGQVSRGRSRPVTTKVLLQSRTVRRMVLSVTLFIALCGGIAWRLNNPPATRQAGRSSETSAARETTDTDGAPPIRSEADHSPARSLPDGSFLVKLPDFALVFGKGSPPRDLADSLRSSGQGGGFGRLSTGGGIWQVVLSRRAGDSGDAARELQRAAPELALSRVLELGAVGSRRFGDTMTILALGELEGELYPPILGIAPKGLGFGVGRLVWPGVPTKDKLPRVVPLCQAPTWLELQLQLQQFPPDWATFEQELTTALRRLAPCLEAICVGQAINTGGWLGTPVQLGELMDRVRQIARSVAPDIEIRFGPFSLDERASPVDLNYYLALPQARRVSALALHVDDIDSDWASGLESCRKVAQASGLGRIPWNVMLRRLHRTSPRYLAAEKLGKADDVEMLETMRAAVRAAALGASRIYFPELRATLQGPLFIDIFEAGITGKVTETEGGGARAFRYLLSRLAEASPADLPLPKGVEGAVLDLPDRRVWFLWAADGTHRWIDVPVRTSAATIARLSPVPAWNRVSDPPMTVQAARQGAISADVDDGLLAVEELPL